MYTFYDGLSVPPVDPYHLHHGRRDPDDEGRSVACCAFADGAKPDSARVTSSAKRNRSSKATRSRAALSMAAAASSSGAPGLADPYAHEPVTTAATVSPCARIRTRSQLFNERDWPLRIFVIAITSATVVAAAPVAGQSACLEMYDRRWRTDRNERLLLEFTHRLFTIGFT
jgi:hypothetical protein